MTLLFSRFTMVAGGAGIALLCGTAALAQNAVLEGVFALPGVEQAVTGKLNVIETGPLTRQIQLTYTEKASGQQIADFEVELTKQLHILAIDAELTGLIHEHAEVARGIWTAG